MGNNFLQSKPIQEGLRLMNQCPVCKGAYLANQKNVLEERGEAHLVHVTCPHCFNSMMAVVVATQLGLSSVGMLTDLDANDAIRLAHRAPLSEDELFAFHQLLKEKSLLLEILSNKK